MSKGDEMKKKGKILIDMKDLFGPERSKEYFRFIEENFAQGRNAIIEKWLEIENKH